MSDTSVARVGGAAAIGVALASLATGVAAALMSAELQARPDVTPHEFWLALAREPGAHLAMHWAFAALGLLGIGAVPALSAVVRTRSPGVVGFASALAYLGFAVTARGHLMEVAFDRKVLPLYAEGSAAFQEAVQVVAGLALDVPDGVLSYGAVGSWILVVSGMALRRGGLPRWLGWVGLALAASYAAGVLGYTLLWRPGVLAAFVLGGVTLGPLWFAGAGVWLLREARTGG